MKRNEITNYSKVSKSTKQIIEAESNENKNSVDIFYKHCREQMENHRNLGNNSTTTVSTSFQFKPTVCTKSTDQVEDFIPGIFNKF